MSELPDGQKVPNSKLDAYALRWFGRNAGKYASDVSALGGDFYRLDYVTMRHGLLAAEACIGRLVAKGKLAPKYQGWVRT